MQTLVSKNLVKTMGNFIHVQLQPPCLLPASVWCPSPAPQLQRFVCSDQWSNRRLPLINAYNPVHTLHLAQTTFCPHTLNRVRAECHLWFPLCLHLMLISLTSAGSHLRPDIGFLCRKKRHVEGPMWPFYPVFSNYIASLVWQPIEKWPWLITNHQPGDHPKVSMFFLINNLLKIEPDFSIN